MKITIESTTRTVELNGVECRIWEGETASGIKIHCFIPRVAVHKDEDAAELERELRECRPPSTVIAETYGPEGVSLRFIL